MNVMLFHKESNYFFPQIGLYLVKPTWRRECDQRSTEYGWECGCAPRCASISKMRATNKIILVFIWSKD